MSTIDTLKLIQSLPELLDMLKNPKALSKAAEAAAAGLALTEEELARRNEHFQIIKEGRDTLANIELARKDVQELRNCHTKETQEALDKIEELHTAAVAKAAEADEKAEQARKSHAEADERHKALDIREQEVAQASVAANKRHKDASDREAVLVKEEALLQAEKDRVTAQAANIAAALELAHKG